MGLDTTHDAWHGAYSAFERWLGQIANAGRVDLPERPLTAAHIRGDWDYTPADPLVYLLAHSDCDGHIHPEHAAQIADRLEEILPNLPDGSGGGHIGDWREKTRTFIAGCRAAAVAGERLEFR